MPKAERKGSSASLRWLRATELELAPVNWGRDVRRADVRQIGFNFDPDLFGYPVVWEQTEREVGAGRFVIIDGQHRVRAVVEILKWTTEIIQCMVFSDIADDEAARISLGHQERRNLHPFDHWRTARAVGVPFAIAIDKAAANAGLTITRRAGHNGEVCAVSAMATCWERLTTPGLTRVLVILRDAWEATPSSFSAKLIRLVMILVANYDGAIDDGRLSRVLGAHGPNVWLSETTPTRRHLGYIAQDVVVAYNTGLRVNRLDDHKSPDDYVAAAKRSAAHPGPRPKVTGDRTSVSTGHRTATRREAGHARKP